ncbi:MAG TPA: PQQ-dependent sugar dehydrogenase, partial [Gemmatimonadales bacterium]|nr:PQQ-dependent sugar dehydrogenase [Gemmatimonadales bacterium]
TIGHRNPQGLFIDPNGAVWETEHGPQGGDELNLLEAGLNYGWPHVTYGTDYNKHTWPRNPVQGQHTGYTMPVYVWLPSIGTSNLIRLRGDLFPLWKDDLIVSSLVGGEVFRIRLDGKRVVFAEPLRIGERVRDLIEDHTGRIIMWTDSRSIIEMRPSKSPLESVNNTAQDAPR